MKRLILTFLALNPTLAYAQSAPLILKEGRVAQAGPSDALAIPGSVQAGIATSGLDAGSQIQVYQTEPSYLPRGSLGAVYCQRLDTYGGGAANDSSSPVTAACRGYNQIGSGVTHAVESGGLFTTDNYSYLAQGVGVYGQTNTRHGGRGWGAVFEADEYPETFTATSGQTVFTIPNGFNAVSAVSKNGTLLLRASYSVNPTSGTVTLTSGASGGDVIKIYRGDPAYGTLGAEIDVFASYGTDTANPNSGNRNGLNVYAYRFDKSLNVHAHVGSVINVISDPSDASYILADRGINFQGQFAAGIDFTSRNATFSTALIKTNAAGAGLIDSTRLMIGDASAMGRVQVSAGSGMIVGSDTSLDVLLTRQRVEQARFNSSGFAMSVPVILDKYTVATLPTCVARLEGAMAYVTDAMSPTYNGTLTGGGSIAVPAFCNGRNWTAH